MGSAVPVDPSDLRPALDGDVGRIEAKVLDHDLPGWMFLCHGRRMFVCPGDGHSEKRAPTTSAATVINKIMRLISVTSPFSFSGPTVEHLCIKVLRI